MSKRGVIPLATAHVTCPPPPPPPPPPTPPSRSSPNVDLPMRARVLLVERSAALVLPKAASLQKKLAVNIFSDHYSAMEM